MKQFLRKAIAKLKGTFVADCPVCHLHFYGNESYGIHVKINHKHYRYVCHRCVKEHKV